MKKKILIITPIAVLALAGTLFALEKTGVTNFYTSDQAEQSSSTTTPNESTIDYSPATSTDNEDINKKKDGTPTDPSPSVIPQDTAVVTITRANATTSGVDVTVLLSGISDGTCALTLTQGSTSVTSSSVIKRDGQYTFCDTFNVDRSKLTEGKWQVTVVAKSVDGAITGTGTSDLQI
jgi:hypothetical protein